MSLSTAKKHFEENLNLVEEPEKENLYKGLLNLTEALRKIEEDLEYIKGKLKYN